MIFKNYVIFALLIIRQILMDSAEKLDMENIDESEGEEEDGNYEEN